MITKKDIPVDLLKTIEPLAQNNLDIIQLKKEENTYYCFIETDSNSKNFFKIFVDGSKLIGNFDGTKHTYEWKPASTSNAKHSLVQANLKVLEEQFQSWLQLIRDVHETPSVHDDNFAKQYADFYYNEFKIYNEDAYTTPFNPNQQDLIEVYLLSLSYAIEQSDEKIPELTKQDLLNDIQVIKSTLTTRTKNQVMKDLTKVFGKLYKISKTLTKEIVTEAKKHLIKKLIMLGIEYGPKLLEIFSK